MNRLKDIEVEITHPLLNPREVLNRLRKVARIDRENVFQQDIYFVPRHRNFLVRNPIREWLRIREANNKVILNYKNWHNVGKKQAVSCDEYETEIKDVKALKNILKSLDFKPIVGVKKVRSTWQYKKAEIAIDKVKYLGNYIELEARGDFKTINEASAYLYKILKELKAKTEKQDFKGYPHLLLEKKGLIKKQ